MTANRAPPIKSNWISGGRLAKPRRVAPIIFTNRTRLQLEYQLPESHRSLELLQVPCSSHSPLPVSLPLDAQLGRPSVKCPYRSSEPHQHRTSGTDSRRVCHPGQQFLSRESHCQWSHETLSSFGVRSTPL